MARKDRSAAQSLFGAIVSVFRPPRSPFAPKPCTITSPGSLWGENLAQSPQRKGCRAKTSHNHPSGKSAGRKTRTIASPESLRAENLTQSPQRKVCGLKTSHNHPTEKSVGRKTRTIAPTGIVWGENLAQSPHRKVCGAKTSHNHPTEKSVGRKPRTIAPTRRFWGERLALSAQRESCGAKTSHYRPNEAVLGRKTCSIARHRSVSAGCPPQDFRDFMAEPQPEAFGRCFGKRWPTVGLGLPTRSVIQDLRREMLPFCDLPSPLEKYGSVF